MKRNLIGIVCFIKLFIVALSPALAQQLIERPVVRLIYFVPRDSAPQPNINADLDRMIKRIRRHYANEMERHGYGRKTFNIETDANGNAVVHRLTGKLNAAVYPNDGDALFGQIEEEIGQRYNLSRNIYLVVAKTSAAIGGRGTDLGLLGAGGMALIPSFGSSFNFRIAAHELGHTFGLLHDFSNDNYLLSYGGGIELSVCDAEWLDLHRAFNESSPAANTPSNIKMLPPSLAAQPDAIRLRFEVSDPDGLHQVQLLAETLTGSAAGYLELIDCKQVKGNSATVEFVTTRLRPESKVVLLRTLDANRNSVSSGPFPIYVTQLLQQVREVSIPDANLAAAIREKIGNSITTYTLLYLRHLYARDREIRDLSGLEHAHNLKFLYLGGNAITDVSPLANLTQLTLLWMPGNAVSDLSQFTTMINLNYLYLSNNGITDVSPLTNLTHLKALDLGWNGISDVSPLANLTQLELLSLRDNYITDISPLLGLNLSGTEDDNTGLDIRGNPLNRASVQTHIPALQARGIAVESDPVKNLAPRAVGNVAPQTLRLGGEPLVLDMARYFRDPEGSTLTYGVWSNQSSIVRVEREGAQITITPVAKGTATVVVRASDPERLGDIQRISVTVNERENRAPQVVGSVAAQTLQVGGKPLVLDMSGYFQDPDENPLTYRISLNPAGIVRVKRAGAQITLTPVAKGTATVVVRASDPDGLHVSQSISVTVKKQPAIQPPIAVLIPDPVLARAIREEIGDSITTHTILNLTRLEVWASNLKGLSGIEHAHNLEELILKESRLTDLSPLATLTQLKSLRFWFVHGHRVSDLSPLTNLTQLENLRIDNLDLSDISPLAKVLTTLTNLESLNLSGGGPILDVSPLANLTNLTQLNLGWKHLSDISPLAKVLTTLINLESLNLPGNDIIDISPLANLTNLTQLNLDHNDITDISPLANLTQLTKLYLGNDGGGPSNRSNAITDISPLANLKNLTQLNLSGNDIIDISPLANLKNLTQLNLSGNDIIDISPLANLKNLTQLNLSDNNITDISVLANLTHLTKLYLGNDGGDRDNRSNAITDISPLANLTQLTQLYLGYNDITDISLLANLTQLTQLYLGYNDITDISLLANFTNLTYLDLEYNDLTDISPLVGLNLSGTWRFPTNYGTHIGLHIRGNPLNYASVHTHIPAMQARGIVIAFDNRAHSALLKVSGDTQQSAGGTTLADPLVVKAVDPHGAPIAGRTVRFKVPLRFEEHHYTITATTDANGEAQATIRLAPNPGLSRIYVKAEGIRYGVSFTAIATSPEPAEDVSIPDANLAAAIREEIGDSITTHTLLYLTSLYAVRDEIRDLSGLEHAHNLTELNLWGNDITDISPLANLTNLTELNLSDNDLLSDISPLANLTNLTELNLSDNDLLSDISPLANLTNLTGLNLSDNDLLSDISPLANLTQLTQLGLGWNGISDISPLANLTQLTGLGLQQNGITDVSPLANLTNLTELNLSDNDLLSDISPLANLTKLTQLYLEDNDLTDISPLANLANLEILNLEDNDITDISPLANLANLEILNLEDNDITDISPLTHLTHLTWLNVHGNNITDIAPLTQPEYLDLSDNNITDIAPLLGLKTPSGAFIRGPGGYYEQQLDLSDNPLNRASLQTHIPALQARGVVVEFDKPAQAAPVLLPKETLLLTNYPNPFNPETWIPYQLAEPAEVSLRIYALNGALVRTLDLGHQLAGNYQSRSRAAHWDGRNELGERVASGLYFYTFTAGEFTATRKMLIRK